MMNIPASRENGMPSGGGGGGGYIHHKSRTLLGTRCVCGEVILLAIKSNEHISVK